MVMFHSYVSLPGGINHITFHRKKSTHLLKKSHEKLQPNQQKKKHKQFSSGPMDNLQHKLEDYTT